METSLSMERAARHRVSMILVVNSLNSKGSKSRKCWLEVMHSILVECGPLVIYGNVSDYIFGKVESPTCCRHATLLASPRD